MDTGPGGITPEAIAAAVKAASDGNVVSLRTAVAALRALCPHADETDLELCEILIDLATHDGRAVLLDTKE